MPTELRIDPNLALTKTTDIGESSLMQRGIHLAPLERQAARRDELGSQRIQEARVAAHEPRAEGYLLCGRSRTLDV